MQEDTPQQIALTKKGNSRTKCMKVATGNLKKDAKTGKGHKTSHNIQIQRTSIYTVQAVTGHVIVQQDISTRHHLPPILLAVQVHILLTIFLDFQILHPNNILSRVSLQPPVIPAGTPETSDSTSTKTGQPTSKTFSASKSTIQSVQYTTTKPSICSTTV